VSRSDFDWVYYLLSAISLAVLFVGMLYVFLAP